jgi:predicted 2-oxoglutarate/Fe(II)-dependent dioxygenase YbiX
MSNPFAAALHEIATVHTLGERLRLRWQWLDASRTIATAPWLSAAQCASFRAEAEPHAKRVDYAEGSGYVPQRRSEAGIAADAVEWLQVELGLLFACRLQPAEALGYRQYQAGDWMRRHVDAPYTGGMFQVSASVLLNAAPPHPSAAPYTGGGIAFAHDQYGAPFVTVTGPEGLIVAFRGTLWHEVPPVLSGVRHSIVAQFR